MPSTTKWTSTPLGRLVTEHGYTLQSLAERLGLTPLYTRYLLLGTRPLTLQVIQKLHALGFPLEGLHKIVDSQRR